MLYSWKRNELQSTSSDLSFHFVIEITVLALWPWVLPWYVEFTSNTCLSWWWIERLHHGTQDVSLVVSVSGYCGFLDSSWWAFPSRALILNYIEPSENTHLFGCLRLLNSYLKSNVRYSLQLVFRLSLLTFLSLLSLSVRQVGPRTPQ